MAGQEVALQAAGQAQLLIDFHKLLVELLAQPLHPRDLLLHVDEQPAAVPDGSEPPPQLFRSGVLRNNHQRFGRFQGGRHPGRVRPQEDSGQTVGGKGVGQQAHIRPPALPGRWADHHRVGIGQSGRVAALAEARGCAGLDPRIAKQFANPGG